VTIFDKAHWFKGNLHTHTTCSDGHASPEEATALYRAAGYDFLAITDHRKSIAREGEGITLLTGVEYDYTLAHEVVHIVGVGLERASTPEEDARAMGGSPQTGIDVIRSLGGRAILAHPAWSLNGPDTLASLRDVTAAEVFNSVSTAPWNGDRGDSSGILDVAAARGCILPMVASDDTHFYDGDQCRAATWINADDCSRESILEALDAGRFFASLGPRFTDISLEDGVLRVACSPVEKIVFYSNMPWVGGRSRVASGQTDAVYALQPGDTFVRCQITDAEGRSAWTSPIALG